jgi:hypothetical protein
MKMPSGFGAYFPFYYRVKMLCGADYSNSMQRLANQRKYIVNVTDPFSFLLPMRHVLKPLPLFPHALAFLRALLFEMQSAGYALWPFPVWNASWRK